MARLTTKRAVQKARKKIKTVDNAHKHVFDFSSCDEMSGQEFHRFRSKCYRFYYQNCKMKNFDSFMLDWMKENKYSREDRVAVRKTINARMTFPSVGIFCRLLSTGCPDLHEEHATYWASLEGTIGEMRPISSSVKKSIADYIQRGKKIMELEGPAEEVKVDEKKKPSIQDRINDQVKEYCSEIDGMIDDFINKHDQEKTINILKSMGFGAIHAKRIRGVYENELLEIETALELYSKRKLSQEEKDLVEGYKSYKRADLKRIVKYYREIIDALVFIAEEKKTTRRRKTKTPSKEKMIQKALQNFKYMKSNPDLKMASKNPQDIIGAKEVWTFEFKYRILKYFVVDPHENGLMLKGNSIVGYDKVKSHFKKIRKPEDVLGLFKTANKTKCRKIMKELSTKPGELKSGRSSETNLIIKVF